jgi:hypothetical protein
MMMTDQATTTRKTAATRIIGAEPAGVTKKVATGLGSRIKEAFGSRGKHVKIKGMRFIPSTKVDLGQGSFQVMANTVVEVSGANGRPARAQAFDSVVTVTHRTREGQTLEGVRFPSLEA